MAIEDSFTTFGLMRVELNPIIMTSGCVCGLLYRKKDEVLPKIVEEEGKKPIVERKKPAVMPSPVEDLSDDKFNNRLEQVCV
jgi:hypothetical protein